MANCGCTETVPCGTQECGCKFEVDAGCVRYSGTELSCIDAQTGDRLSDILIDLNAKFCDLINGNYIEVSQEPVGPNCDEGGLKIVVKNIKTEAIINTEYLCTVVDYYVLPTATSSILGGVKIGSGLTINGSGVLSTTNDYTLPTATSSILGGIKIGSGLTIDSSGILSVIPVANYDEVIEFNQLTPITAGVIFSPDTPELTNVLYVSSIDASAWIWNGTDYETAPIVDNTEWYLAGTTIDAGANKTGKIYRNGSVGINANPILYASSKFIIRETLSNRVPFKVDYSATGISGYVTNVGGYIGVSSLTSQNGTLTALQLRASDARGLNEGLNIGVSGSSAMAYPSQVGLNCYVGPAPTMQGTNITNYGIYSSIGSQNSTSDSVGIYSSVDTVLGGGKRYAAQLLDGTQGIGKVLTCIDANGKANWADPTNTNLQKETEITYELTNADNDYTIFINNTHHAITISLGAITIPNFSVGFIQEGTGDVTFSGTGLSNPVGLKLKGQGYQAFIERKLSTSTYYLLGNTKA